MSGSSYTPKYDVSAANVHAELNNYILTDGFDIVLDQQNSQGSYMVDAKSGKKYLDFFTCFASMPIGINHPKMMDPAFIEYLGKAAINKPSNSDLYTEEMATFVKTFFEIAVPDAFKYGFFIEGGGLAVENALKVAFDWKVQKNFAKGHLSERGTKIMHFKQAFHGRTGYTMSLTNTDPNKVKYFPKFDWPRINNPALMFPTTEANMALVREKEALAINQMKQAFFESRDEIAGIIIEPIQGEGGDNHFSKEFFAQMRQLADENDALLIFDEVQTGMGITGTWWAHEQTGVTPDIMSFGKKAQVCGIVATDRVNEVPHNVFKQSSRINSTWGGNLADMVRTTRYLEIIEEENLVNNAKTVGEYLMSKLDGLVASYPSLVSNQRGAGLFAAFDLPNADVRGKFANECMNNGLIIITSGEKSMRFRPPLNLSTAEVDEGIAIIENALKTL